MPAGQGHSHWEEQLLEPSSFVSITVPPPFQRRPELPPPIQIQSVFCDCPFASASRTCWPLNPKKVREKGLFCAVKPNGKCKQFVPLKIATFSHGFGMSYKTGFLDALENAKNGILAIAWIRQPFLHTIPSFHPLHRLHPYAPNEWFGLPIALLEIGKLLGCTGDKKEYSFHSIASKMTLFVCPGSGSTHNKRQWMH